MSDLIDRQVAIEAIARRDTTNGTVKVFGGREVVEIIKSLPSAQPENRMERDVISRQAAIKAFKDFLTIHDSRGVEYLCPAVTMDGVNKILSDLPSAQPERKTGRWLQISPAKIYECSECAQMVMTDDISCYKYCHGCGAYMGGGEGV